MDFERCSRISRKFFLSTRRHIPYDNPLPPYLIKSAYLSCIFSCEIELKFMATRMWYWCHINLFELTGWILCRDAAAGVGCVYNVPRRSNLLSAIWSGGPEAGLSFAHRRNVRSILPTRGGQCTQWVFSTSSWSRQLLPAQEPRTSRRQEFCRIWFPVWWWAALQLQLVQLLLRSDCMLLGLQLCGMSAGELEGD
jgi:hypothetical protein